MNTKMSKAEREQAAINAGFWVAKDHGRWFAGRDLSTRVAGPFASKAEARAAMVAAWEASAAA
jgi:hypothetical protein